MPNKTFQKVTCNIKTQLEIIRNVNKNIMAYCRMIYNKKGKSE